MQVVLICGGRGTRLPRGGAGQIPKSLVKVGGEPMLGRLLRQFAPAGPGLRRPPVILIAKGDAYTPAFVDGLAPHARIVEQPAPDGVANAMFLTRRHVRGPALYLLGDLVLNGRFDEPWPEPPAVGVWPEAPDAETQRNYGVRVHGGRVVEVTEKPPPGSGLVCGMGAYFLTPQVVEMFADVPANPVTREREITEAISHVMRRGLCLNCLRFRGWYGNINTGEQLAEAERQLRSQT